VVEWVDVVLVSFYTSFSYIYVALTTTQSYLTDKLNLIILLLRSSRV
jgi:hypothetical protein